MWGGEVSSRPPKHQPPLLLDMVWATSLGFLELDQRAGIGRPARRVRGRRHPERSRPLGSSGLRAGGRGQVMRGAGARRWWWATVNTAGTVLWRLPGALLGAILFASAGSMLGP